MKGLVGEGRDAAREWVLENASRTPGFLGAFFHGSTNELADADELSSTSDVDVVVVLDDPHRPTRRGKLHHRGVLLDVSFLPSAALRDPRAVLGHYQLAPSFRTPGIILDPTGQLTELQAAVSKDYAKRAWVRRRCANAASKALRAYALSESQALPDQVIAWLFPAGIATHVLLVAGLKIPTVRTRYLAVRNVLAEYGHMDVYEGLLGLLGCAQLGSARVEAHLKELSGAFDAAAAALKTPVVFASDLSALARPIAIGGSRALIEDGDHREAVFWIAVTASRCQIVLARDAPGRLYERFEDGYRALLADLGIATLADLEQRAEALRRLLPRVEAVAGAIVAENPSIEE